MNAIRLIIFTIAVPGFVVGYMPYALYDVKETVETGFFRYTGLILIFMGTLFYMRSALNFLVHGGGTPAIWFSKHLKLLIGEEPFKLVSSGIYKYSRNPMYLGVIMVVYGLSIFFESKDIFVYACMLIVFFHIVIIFLEEPHLRRKYGEEFERYLQETNRWFGVKSIK